MRTEFNAQFINQVVSDIERLAVERSTKIAIHAHNLITIRTPKDTGQAWAGWNFTLNDKSFAIPQKPRKGEPRLPPALSVPNMKASKIGDTYYLVNAVQHIIYLNEGHSTQAPSNFVEQELVSALRDIEAGQ